VRGFTADKGWLGSPYGEYQIPLRINFEFDAAMLYAEVPESPSWMKGEFTTPVQLPGTNGIGHFYAHGYIDQIGQETTGDPAYVFRRFGRDVIDAALDDLL
jgi:hypothetical protein